MNQKILIYNISYKPLRIRLDKIDGFIKIYDGTRYLVLFGAEKYFGAEIPQLDQKIWRF